MKDDKPQGKSQKDSSKSRPQTEEDLDFEILDALENLERAEKAEADSSIEEAGEADEFDLDLDDDLMFDEEHIGDTEEFQIDSSVVAGLGLTTPEDGSAQSTELTGDLADFGLDTNLGDDVHIDENDDGSFSLDLDQDEEDFDLSFDDEIDLDLDENFEGPTFEDDSFDNEVSFNNEASFDNEGDIEATQPVDTSSSDLNLNVFDASSLEMQDKEESPLDTEEIDTTSTEAATQDSLDTASDGEPEDAFDNAEIVSGAGELSGAEIPSGAEALLEAEPLLDTSDFSNEDDADLDLDNLPDLDETMAEFDTSLDASEGVTDTEFGDMEQDTEQFAGKGVISIDGDQVIDLGDEDDISSITDADSASWDDDGFPEESISEESIPEEDDFSEEEADMDLAELAKGAQQLVSADEADTADTSEEENGDFMDSLDDIHIDLHDDDDESETFGADVDVESLDLPEDEDSLEEEPSDEEFDVPSLSEVLTEVETELGVEGSVDAEPPEEPVAESGEEPQEAQEPEVDVREALGLVPRLLDEDITKFEQMVLEAKTLQQYIEELADHQPEIKTKIYHKLFKEYSDRKADIFREPEFISIRIDVEQDLEDMLRKRNDVHDTMSSLHDELEEVQVRHLVGEYTDEDLSEQETSRKADIDEWQQKSERLEQFITQYQELLETEKVLNPIEEDVDTNDEGTGSTEDIKPGLDIDASTDIEEEISEEAPEVSELEAIVSEEAEEMPEEPLVQEEEISVPDEEMPVTEPEDRDSAEVSADISMDDLSDEIESIEGLSDILADVDDSGDWEDGEDEELEFTAEGFDEDLALGDELTGLDEEDFELDDFSDDASINTDAASIADVAAAPEEEKEKEEDATDQEEEMVSCKKCGRPTPASEKFCVNCGGKAQ